MMPKVPFVALKTKIKSQALLNASQLLIALEINPEVTTSNYLCRIRRTRLIVKLGQSLLINDYFAKISFKLQNGFHGKHSTNFLFSIAMLVSTKDL